MKKTFIMAAIMLSGFIAGAQNRLADTKAIEKQVDAMVNSWNKHNYNNMSSYTTTDCDWVNIVGMWWKNRKEFAYSIKAYHQTIFKSTTMKKLKVDVRFITDNVAVVHFKSNVGTFTTPDGTVVPASDELALLVYLKKDGKWLMTAGENVTIIENAKKNDPVLHMPKM
jgi:uncharacterized protein (TIGR02246 family)